MASVPQKVTFQEICSSASKYGLDEIGAFHPLPQDYSGAQSLILLGPGKGFWAHFENSSEYQDEAPNPIDRWSDRVIKELASILGAKPFLPFGGPPYAPFIEWAQQSGRAQQSPLGMLVHDSMGLMVSFRGALGFDYKIKLSEKPVFDPCSTCEQKPCLNACPIGALSEKGYEVPKCKSYLWETEGQICMQSACQVRGSCPYSENVVQDPRQTALHMRAFRGNR